MLEFIEEYGSLAIAMLAFLLSSVATVVSWITKQRSQRDALRSQLTENVMNLVELSAEMDRAEPTDPVSDREKWREWTTLSTRFDALTRLAVSIAKRIHDDISDVECSALAEALEKSNDSMAGEYWEKAIAKTSRAHPKILYLRGYARYLFKSDRSEEGASRYAAAVAVPVEAHARPDEAFLDAYTYCLWGFDETVFGSAERGQECFGKAEALLEVIHGADARARVANVLAEFRNRAQILTAAEGTPTAEQA